MNKHDGDEDRLARRDFIKGTVGVGITALLFSVGAFRWIVGFFGGPQVPPKEEAQLLKQRLSQHKETTELEKLKLERVENDYLTVAQLADLSANTGKYFYDYEMRPALAFLDDDGFPLLISAKCTHLGCTVGNTVNANGQILCPCHFSYFNIHSGVPSKGPAVLPLAHFGWVLKDPDGKVLAHTGPTGKVVGSPEPAALKTCVVLLPRTSEQEGGG